MISDTIEVSDVFNIDDLNHSFLLVVLKKISNMSKCEIVSIGSLKGVETAVCGMKKIDLTKDAVKITEVSFLYNKAIQNALKFITTISKIQVVLKL